MHCFACDQEIPLVSGERIGFRDVCSRCGADLHVCRNCAHHDPAAYNECREPNADWTGDRERANRCDYFAPGARRGGTQHAERERVHGALDSLFGKKS